MIRNVVPLAFDSFGIRSMATFSDADDLGVSIDPSVSLAPLYSTWLEGQVENK